jgi:hypothetical protein
MSDFDSAWKEALDRYFERFLAFFFGDIVAALDPTRDYEVLDQELQKLAPAGEVGRRQADKLVKVYKKSGDARHLHVEVQCQPQDEFPHRMYVYGYRIEDRYNDPVIGLVILGDDNPEWRPTEYVFEEWGTRTVRTFRSVKLLDYLGKEAELEAEANPFALLVLTHLQALATRNDPAARAAWKLRLVKGLYDRELDAEDVRQWYRYFDWLLDLPAELEQQVWKELAQFEEEKHMPHITSVERIGMEKGERKGLLQAIELGLELKFAGEGLKLLPEIAKHTDLALLRTIVQAIRTGASLDDLRRLLPEGGPATT